MVAKTDPIRRIARIWFLLGLCGLAFLAVVGAAHFIFGAPVHDKRTGALVSSDSVAWLLAFMALGFGFFFTVGYILLRKMERPST
jgi:hypothetical protein